MSVTAPSLRDRITGCWRGKAVGGTLGQTFEGLSGPLDADFYFPVPTEMVPNDDLDLQVVYAVVMDQAHSTRVDRHELADAWSRHVSFPWNEYGVGMRNLAEGIRPPFTGTFDNWFTCGEGAAIRSELWACLAPGDPDRAGAFAYEDACFDHAGDGIYAAQFLARLQSLAFVESDVDTLIDTALAGIPSDSGIAAVVRDTRSWSREYTDWRDVRALIVRDYGSQDFTDVRQNTGFVILGWLHGRDFSEAINITNNCGEDCDSSTASVGALLGILNPSAIDEKWLSPIGDALTLSPEITDLDAPATLDEFTDLVQRVADRLDNEHIAAEVEDFEPAAYAIPVQVAHFNTIYSAKAWKQRDQSELPPPEASLPELEYAPATLPGTWVKLTPELFEDRLLMIRYDVNTQGRDKVRLMVNATEDYRVWIDEQPVHAAQGSRLFFPAPHAAPIGQTIDLELTPGRHTLHLAIKRPPLERVDPEMVVALVELPSILWIPNAFRP